MSAGTLLRNWSRMTRAFSLTDQAGANPQPCRGVLRGLTEAELVGALDQDEQLFIAAIRDLQTAGYYPLPKFTRVVDGARTYTVQSETSSYAGKTPMLCRARVKG